MEHGEQPVQRTRWVEEFSETFTGIPFVRECVYRGMTFLSKGIEKEVCDLLVAQQGRAIVVQMKNQEDPDSRTPEKLTNWVRKNALSAAGQMTGALRRLQDEQTWCEHPRRGRAEFTPGSLAMLHAVVLVECRAARVELPEDAPQELRGVSVTYLDTNDFLNVVDQLRSFGDVERFLTARAKLGMDVRGFIGGERPILEHYALTGETFDGWTGYDREHAASEAEAVERRRAFIDKQEKDRAAGFMEYVADALATRSPIYAKGLDPETRARFDADDGRMRYLTMQDALTDLSLPNRRMLGGAMLDTFQPPDGANRFTYRALWADSKPNFAYVLISSHGVERRKVLARAQLLLTAALAQLSFSAGLAIVDRDSVSFEVVHIPTFVATPEDRAGGAQLFGSLRVADVHTNLMGETRRN
jgi:hypothetical protein